MNPWQKIKAFLGIHTLPVHLQRGNLGEKAARKYLQQKGLKFLTANFRSRRGEIDLIFRNSNCLIFVEVKTRSSEEWVRPAAAVNARKRKLISGCAMDYLKRINRPQINIRFDIIEVLLEKGQVRQIRHLENAFTLSPPYRYG